VLQPNITRATKSPFGKQCIFVYSGIPGTRPQLINLLWTTHRLTLGRHVVCEGKHVFFFFSSFSFYHVYQRDVLLLRTVIVTHNLNCVWKAKVFPLYSIYSASSFFFAKSPPASLVQFSSSFNQAAAAVELRPWLAAVEAVFSKLFCRQMRGRRWLRLEPVVLALGAEEENFEYLNRVFAKSQLASRN
jgi:hypothetical protein